MHVGGVDVDERTGLISIVADAGVAFNTFGQNITGPNYAMLYDPVKKKLLYTIELNSVTNHDQFGGYQDLEQDPRGNVYVVGTFSSSILKISADGKKLEVWYLEQPVNHTRSGLSGLAAKGDILLSADSNTGQIVRFDTSKPKGTQVVIPTTPPNKMSQSDGVYLPPKYDGKVLLVAVDLEGTAVFLSRDGKWQTAEYKGLIPRLTTGIYQDGAVTASVQIAQSIYTVLDWFDPPIPGSLAGNRTVFPMVDITREVDALVRK